MYARCAPLARWAKQHRDPHEFPLPDPILSRQAACSVVVSNFTRSIMLTKLTLGVLAAGLTAGCATDSKSSDPGAGSDDPGGDGDVPFTNGVSTLAGTTQAGYIDGSRAVARFSNPTNVIYRDGTLYVADFDNG